MIVTGDQYFVLLGNFITTPVHVTGTTPVQTYNWTSYGPFADQTECIKMLMTGTYAYEEMKIVKVNLPLLKKADHGTVDISETIELTEEVELTDEQPSK